MHRNAQQPNANRRRNGNGPRAARGGQPAAPRGGGVPPAGAPQPKAARGKRAPPVRDDPVPERPEAPAELPPPRAPAVDNRRYEGYVQTANNWMPKAVPNSDAAKYLASIGVGSRAPAIGRESDTNRHPAQAGERGAATSRGLGLLYARGHRRVTSVYGNPRDESINDYCNSQVPPTDTRMEVIRYSPALTTKDHTRRPTTITFGDAVRGAQTLLFVDVYETDVSSTGLFDPPSIALMLNLMVDPYGSNRILWIGRCFYGSGGVVAGEGGWFRDERGKIIFRSSPDEPTEYSNDPCDWMWKTTEADIQIHGNPAVLSWGVVKVVGSFKLVAFNCTPRAGIPTAPVASLYPYDEYLVEVKCPSSAPFVQPLLPYLSYLPSFVHSYLPFQKTRIVIRPCYQIARTEAISRRYNQVNFVRISNLLVQSQQSDPEASLFLRLFPKFLINRDISSIAWGIVLDDIHERHVTMSVANALHGERMAEINLAQAMLGAPPSPREALINQLQFGKTICVLAFLFFVLRTRKTWNAAILRAASKILWMCRSLLFKNPSSASLLSLTAPFLPSAQTVCRHVDRFIMYCIPAVPPHPNLTPLAMVGIFLFRDGFAAPVLEESLKRLHPSISTWLPRVELVLSLMQTPVRLDAGYVLMRLMAFYAHHRFNQMSYGKSMICHSIYNILLGPAVVYTLGEFFGFEKLRPEYRRNVSSGSLLTKITWFAFFTGLAMVTVAKFLQPKREDPELYLKWKKRFFEDSWEDRAVLEDSRSYTCLITDNRVPEQESDLPIAPYELERNPRCVVKANYFTIRGLFPVTRPKLQQYFWHILPTNAPGFVPASTERNLQVAISHRLLQDPPLAPMVQRDNWRHTTHMYGDCLLEIIDKHPLITESWYDLAEDWLEHFTDNKKKKMYREVVEEIKREGTLLMQPPKTTDTFVKHDEMLMQQKEGRYILKPRIIANVAPQFQARAGPYVHRAQKALGAHWNVNSEAICLDMYGVDVYYHFMTGGGTSDHDLSLWFEKVLNHGYFPLGSPGVAILACGDDSVVIYVKPRGGFVIFEADARNFDCTESHGPLEWERSVLLRLGIPFQICQALYASASNTLRAMPHRREGDQVAFEIDCKERPMRRTGDADTYLGNTIVMISAWYFVLQMITYEKHCPWDDCTVEMFREAFLFLGFDMKIKIHRDPTAVTFLKGMWYEVEGKYIWGPLPSRILKAGKTLRDPRSLYGTRDMKLAAGEYLSDVSNSYSVFLQVPIVRAFVARYKKKSVIHSSEAEIAEHNAKASGFYQSLHLDAAALSSTCNRYDVNVEDILRVEEMIMQSEPLLFMHDPVFLKLALVDYA